MTDREQELLAALKAKLQRDIARLGPSCDNENYAVSQLTLAEARQALAAIASADAAASRAISPEHINALPEPVRRYIHALETRCDPSGEVRELVIARDTCKALAVEVAELRAVSPDQQAVIAEAERVREVCEEWVKDGHVRAQVQAAWVLADAAKVIQSLLAALSPQEPR